MEMPHAAPAPRRPGLLINRQYGLLWSAHFISLIGDYIFNTTLVIWLAADLARGQPWAPLAVSGVLIATLAPTLLLGPLAGVFVDRWDKRRTMRVMDALRAVLVGAMVLVTGVVPLPFVPEGRLPLAWQLGILYGMVVLVNAAGQFFTPARTALIGDIVEEPLRARAMGLGQTAVSIALIAGPALAGPLYVAFGPSWALGLDALSFLISFVVVRLLRPPAAARSVAPGQRGHLLREFVAGVRYVASNRTLRVLLVALVLETLGTGALNGLNILFVTQNLHASYAEFGLLSGGLGVGAIVGSLLAAAYAQRLGLARVFWASSLAIAVGVLIYARLTSFLPGLVLLTVVGVPEATINVVLGPIILNATPRAMVGRALAIFLPVMSLAMLISTLVGGYLLSTVLHGFHLQVLGVALGPMDTLFSATGLLILLSGLYALRALREGPPKAVEVPHLATQQA